MKRICLLSDTHNYLDPKIFKYFTDCDQIWHAGDIGTISICEDLEKLKPLTAVYGNIDGTDIRKVYPKNQRFKCEKVDVWMTHIGGTGPGKYPPAIRDSLQIKHPKLFICGHSHILKAIYDKQYNMLYMNPGASGNYGMHKVKTILRFTIDKTDIKDLEIVEFGKI